MRFDVTDVPEDRTLKLSVFSNQSTPDLIGSAALRLDDVLTKGEFDEWVEIKYKDRYAGEVYLEMTFYRSASAGAKDVPAHQRLQTQRVRPASPGTPNSVSSLRMLPDPPISPTTASRSRTAASPLSSPVHPSRQQSRTNSPSASRFNISTDDYHNRVSGYATMPTSVRSGHNSMPSYSSASNRRESYPQSNAHAPPESSPPRKLPWADTDDSPPSSRVPSPQPTTSSAPRLPYPDIASLSLVHRRSSPSLMSSAKFDNTHRPATIHHKAFGSTSSSPHSLNDLQAFPNAGVNVPYSPYDPLGMSPERRSIGNDKPSVPPTSATRRPLPQTPPPSDIPRGMRRDAWEEYRKYNNGNSYR